MGTKVDCLKKDELIYEIKIRGVDVDETCTVNVLRKKLRELLKKKVQPHIKFLSRDLASEWKIIQDKLAEVVESSKESIDKPEVLARLECKIDHVRLRVNNLCQLQLKEASLEACKTVLKKLDECNETLQKSDVNVNEKQEYIRKLSETNVKEEEMIGIDLGTDDVFIEQSVQELSANQTPPVVNVKNEGEGLNNQLYAKLPNPFERYINEIPKTNGLEVGKLIKFIEVLIKIKQETSWSDSQILDIVVNLVETPLRDKVNEARVQNINISKLHENLLKCFVPVNLRENLKRDLVHRPQRVGENLAIYISEVKKNSEILMCSYSEQEIVEIIKLNLNQDTRSKAVFADNPITFSDLDKLVVQIGNISYNDYQRSQIYSKTTRSGPFVSHRAVNTVTDVKKCFICNKPGHLANKCFHKNKAQYSKNV